jgi:surface carbohydrate biosynthesis protein
MKKILYFSHNPARDFTSDSILIAKLKERGYMTWLSTFLQGDGERITIIQPDIVILPEIRCEYSKYIADKCKEFGVQVVVKMCEFGISEESLPNISEHYKTAIFGRFPVNDCVDRFLAWGPRMKDMMVEHNRIDPAKIAVCGGFQFDQYFLPEYPMEEKKKKIMLLVAGFAYADRNKDYSIPEADVGSPLHKYMVEKDQKGRGKWLEAIPKIVAKYGDEYRIRVKIHPGEKPEPYQVHLRGVEADLVMDMPGFVACQQADIVIHAGSTMGYEAHLRDIPHFNFCNNCEDVIVSKVSPNFDTFEGLVEAIDTCDLTKSNADPTIIEQLETEYYGTVDGKGCDRMADAIDTLPANTPDIPKVWPYQKEWLYPEPGMMPKVEQWHCSGCKNCYYMEQSNREMVKCPFCGIANVKISGPGGVPK